MISQSIYDLEAITIIICGLRKTPPVWCQMVNAIQQNPPTKLYCWSSSSCIKKTVPLIIIIMDQQNSTLDLHHHGSKLECPTISFDFSLLTKVLTFQRRIETKFQSLVQRRDGSGDSSFLDKFVPIEREHFPLGIQQAKGWKQNDVSDKPLHIFLLLKDQAYHYHLTNRFQ